MNFSTTVDDFSILKNGIDSTLEIIRHNETGYYNITKIANVINKLKNEKSNDASDNKIESDIENSGSDIRLKRIKDWFRQKSTKELILECKKYIDLEVYHDVMYELRSNVPKAYTGTYVHPIVYNMAISWLKPDYYINVVVAYHKLCKDAKQCIKCNENSVSNVLETICDPCRSLPNLRIFTQIPRFSRKEHHFMVPLSKIYKSELVLDRTITNGKSSRRPDGFIDKLSYVVVIEIDEDQHKSYNCDDEYKRLNDLALDVSHRPIALIRVNPDEYFTSSGELVPSAFYKTNANDLVVVTQEFNKRFTQLCQTIEDIFASPPQSTHVTRLFFDT